jgi:hypothetical protein
VQDALLIQTPLERLDEDIFRIRVHMEQASRIVLGGFTVRTDVVIAKHPDLIHPPPLSIKRQTRYLFDAGSRKQVKTEEQ